MKDQHDTPVAVGDYVHCVPDSENIITGEVWGTIIKIRASGDGSDLATVKYGEDDDTCDFESHEIELEADC